MVNRKGGKAPSRAAKSRSAPVKKKILPVTTRRTSARTTRHSNNDNEDEEENEEEEEEVEEETSSARLRPAVYDSSDDDDYIIPSTSSHTSSSSQVMSQSTPMANVGTLETPLTGENLAANAFSPRRVSKGVVKIHMSLSTNEIAINEEAALKVTSLPSQKAYHERMTYSRVQVLDANADGQSFISIDAHVDLIVSYMLHILAVDGLSAIKVAGRAMKDLTKKGKFLNGVRVLHPQVCAAVSSCATISTAITRISDNWKMKIKTRSEVLFRTIFRVAPAPACFEVNEPSLLRNVSIFILNLIIEITYDC
jgi:hypothetical protein